MDGAPRKGLAAELWALITAISGGVCVLIVTMGALGHHSRSAFALEESIELEGIVKEVGWFNPHAYLVISVPSADGRDSLDWTLEAHSISGLLRLGWRKDSLSVGERVVVRANPNRDSSSRFALLDNVTRADGSTLYSFRRPKVEETAQAIAPSPTQPAVGNAAFTGTWKPVRALKSALLDGFTPPANWPYTARALEEIAGFDIDDDPILDCIATGLPRMIKWPYSQRWTRDGDTLVIETDQSPRVRRIALSDVGGPANKPADRASPVVPTPVGRSVGYFSGENELVIESDALSPMKWGNARGVSSGPDKRVVERYRLLAGGTRLEVRYTLSDPEFLNEPVEVAGEFERITDYPFNKVPCDPVAARRHLNSN